MTTAIMTPAIKRCIICAIFCLFLGIFIGIYIGRANSPVSGCYMNVSCTPLNTVSACFAKNLALLYRQNHWAYINGNTSSVIKNAGQDKIDSRSVWISTERLKRFIYEIETKTQKITSTSSLNPCGIPVATQLGVRFYFGEYPDSQCWSTTPELANWKNYTDDPIVSASAMYSNLHTLILVPTYFDSVNNVDFDPNTGGGFYCKGDTSSLILVPEIMNHGDQAPPPFPCVDYWNSGATFMAYVDSDYSTYIGSHDTNPATSIGKNTIKNSCPPSQ